MSKILIVFALLSFIYATPSNDDLDKTMFHDYITHHRKFYFNEEEHNHRFRVYQSNKAEIMTHNANPFKTFTMSINRFSDLTQTEFLRLYTGADPTLTLHKDSAN